MTLEEIPYCWWNEPLQSMPRSSTVKIHQSLSSCWFLCVLRLRSWGIRVILDSPTWNSVQLPNPERQGPHESCQRSVGTGEECVSVDFGLSGAYSWTVSLGFQKECQLHAQVFWERRIFTEFIWFFCWIGLQLLKSYVWICSWEARASLEKVSCCLQAPVTTQGNLQSHIGVFGNANGRRGGQGVDCKCFWVKTQNRYSEVYFSHTGPTSLHH